MVVDKSACKDDLVQLSRVRHAWKEAHGQVEKTRKRKLEGLVEEGDDPLETSTQESLGEFWVHVWHQADHARDAGRLTVGSRAQGIPEGGSHYDPSTESFEPLQSIVCFFQGVG